MAKAELKPCPFCGGDAHTIIRVGASGVSCEGRDHFVRAYGGTEAEAIAAWNRRSSPTEGGGVAGAEAAARDIWVYFKSFGRAGEGAGETGRWFDNNKSLGGPQWLIQRLAALSRPTGDGEAGATEAFAAVALADTLIERALGTDVPQEWHDAYRAVAEARSKTARSTGGESAGWKLVPVEPTEAMLTALHVAVEECALQDPLGYYGEGYAAMLAASPSRKDGQ